MTKLYYLSYKKKTLEYTIEPLYGGFYFATYYKKNLVGDKKFCKDLLEVANELTTHKLTLNLFHKKYV
jgi:hypothetical protein